MDYIEFKEVTFSNPKENINLEYKTASWELPESFWETYSSFANTDGGKIILGISEDKSKHTYTIEGIDDVENVKTSLWNGLSNLQVISNNLIRADDVITYKSHDKTLIQIQVPRATYDKRPVYIKGHQSPEYTFVRTDDGDRKSKQAEFKYMIVDSQDDIDTELLSNYSIDDLDSDTISDYMRLYSENKKDPSILKMDQYKFLENQGIFRLNRQSNSDKKFLTAGGLLFFGKYTAITERFPNFQIDYVKKKSSNSVDWIDRISTGDMNFENLNIFSFYRTMEPKIPNGIPDRFQQDSNMTRGSYYSDMREAIKEASVNTLMHAYYDSDQPIKIIDYDDYFEFYNPGEMRVTVSEFLHGSISRARNPIISVLFRRVGIAEREAKGGRTIAHTATAHKLRAPEIKSVTDDTTIRLWKIDMESTMSDLMGQEKHIMQIVVKIGSFKFNSMLKNLQKEDPSLTAYSVRQTINSLIQKKYLIKDGNGPATRYYINQSSETGKLNALHMIKRIEDNLHNS